MLNSPPHPILSIGGRFLHPKAALAARLPLMRRLAEEETDCYRLFHGAVEGCPGLTIDRYGTVSKGDGGFGRRGRYSGVMHAGSRSVIDPAFGGTMGLAHLHY